MAIKKSKIQQSLVNLIKDTDVRIQKTLDQKEPFWLHFESWKTACKDAIELIYGQGHRNLVEFNNIRFSSIQHNPTPHETFIAFIIGLLSAKERLSGYLITVENFWEDDPIVAQSILYPTIFLSRSDKAEKLVLKLKEFLKNMGATVVDVLKEPNLNLSLGNKVKLFMSVCNCGIALITAKDKMASGEFRGRPNIDNEIGIMQSSPNISPKIVILKEDPVSLPTNIKEIGHISFNRANFTESFSPLVKELRAFGFY